MWKKPPLLPQEFSLNDEEVNIWLLDINAFKHSLDFFTSILSTDEVARSQRYKFENLQQNFIINRGFLRSILSRYLSCDSQDIQFDYNEKGKPFLSPPQQQFLKFNLSHKNQYTVYGISKIDLGIDLETIDDNVQVKDIAKRFFTEDEYNNLCHLPITEQTEYFFKLWTAKEAYLKAIGQGISAGLDSINFIKQINNFTWKFEILNSLNTEQSLWKINTKKVIKNYFLSIAIKSTKNIKFNYYQVDNLDEILSKK